MRVVEQEDGKQAIEHLMFQHPSDDLEEYRYYVIATLAAYMQILEIFAEPISGLVASTFPKDKWVQAIKQFTSSIEEEFKKQADKVGDPPDAETSNPTEGAGD